MIAFAYTILYVPDVEKAMLFYKDVFGFDKKFISPDGEYGELISGATTLSFAKHSLAARHLPEGYLESRMSEKPFGIEIGFTTDDVEKVFALALQHGATQVAAAKTKPWGQVVAYIRDPDGFLVEICTPMS